VRDARLIAAVALLVSACAPDEPAKKDPSVYGVQLHTHGSLSEGPASMQAHSLAARDLGGAVDVIWWTDHDWRIAGHTYVDGLDFEQGLAESEPAPVALRMAQFDGREPLPDWAHGREWSAEAAPERTEVVSKRLVLRRAPRPETSLRTLVTEGESRTGARSLRLEVRGPPAGRDKIVIGFETTRRRHIASLASGVGLGLSLLPAVVEGDVRFVLSAGLSQRSPGERTRLEYVLQPAAQAGPPSEARVELRSPTGSEARARVAVASIPTEPGVWNDWRLDVSDDAERYALGGADNSLVDLSLVIEVGPGARLEIFVDALTIDREVVGAPLFAAERELARQLSDDVITHHVGQEISYAAHLGAYGAAVPLVDAARYPHGLAPREAVAWVHAHGGLISLAHYFGTEFTMISHRFPRSREAFDASVARLIEQGAYGVDLLEVGYRSRGYGLDAFLELWDALSAAGIRLVGIGVSDSHDAEVGWTSGPNNFITWIHADSVAEGDLLAGLRAGRAFFGDPTRFDGVLDITTAAGGRMGDVLTVAPGAQLLTLHAEGLRSGQSLRVIRDGTPVAVHEPAAAAIRVGHEIDVDAPTFVRFEVLEDGAPVVSSNPIHFVPGDAP